MDRVDCSIMKDPVASVFALATRNVCGKCGDDESCLVKSYFKLKGIEDRVEIIDFLLKKKEEDNIEIIRNILQLHFNCRDGLMPEMD